MFRHIHCRTG